MKNTIQRFVGGKHHRGMMKIMIQQREKHDKRKRDFNSSD
jgi:hypothetical protein